MFDIFGYTCLLSVLPLFFLVSTSRLKLFLFPLHLFRFFACPNLLDELGNLGLCFVISGASLVSFVCAILIHAVRKFNVFMV